MESLMRKHWWKWLGVAILIYGIIAGMLVPLKPNLLSVSPGGADLGATATFVLTGYNTRFTQDRPDIWLNYGDGYALAAQSVEVIDDRRARATFAIPGGLPEPEARSHRLSIIGSSTADGAFVAPGVVTLRQENSPADLDAVQAEWEDSGLQAGALAAAPRTTFPYRGLLGETIRNTYFHVSLWFAMMFLYIAAVVYAIIHLVAKRGTTADLIALDRREKADRWTLAFTAVGTLFGVLGLLTGAMWAKYTWGSYWSWDIKQFTTLVALLIYGGYFVLRASVRDSERRGRLSAAYNIFAFACLIPLIYILPRMSATSLHPGAEGNPAMGGEDLDNTMRMVFYPIIIGWTLFGGWLAGLTYRLRVLAEERLRRTFSQPIG